MDSLYELESLEDEFRKIQTFTLTDKFTNKIIKKIIQNILVFGLKSDKDYIRDSYIDEYSSVDPNNCEIFSYDEVTLHKSSLEQVQERVTDELVSYEDIYNFSSKNIKSEDWDLLFDKMYSLYKKNDIENLFGEDMSKLNRFSITIALLSNRDVLSEDYINSINYIESLYVDDRDSIQCDLINCINNKNTKVVDFNKYKVKRKFDKR